MKPAIEITNLSRSFGDKNILQSLNLRVEVGESVVLRGSNGSGKTTLLRILATLLLPTSGDVYINGFSVSKQPRAVRRQIGWVPATDGGFVPRFTGLDNMQFFGALNNLNKKQVTLFNDKWKSFSSFQMALETPFYLCSAGMKHALAIGRALMTNPDILLFDEPTRSLDETSVNLFRSFCLEDLRDKTIFFTSHAHSEMEIAAGRVIQLKDGMLF
jgi:ABC-type multidrug transport system ATPase subunit